MRKPPRYYIVHALYACRQRGRARLLMSSGWAPSYKLCMLVMYQLADGGWGRGGPSISPLWPITQIQTSSSLSALINIMLQLRQIGSPGLPLPY
ncbi:uncharacterized protein EI90DRAFT_3030720 [Cantharellus anzutake]|uniref:uncharacterized protein n=1 Tax=Cantharellus anzutake TaxID=1750568 RepID=UPI001907F6F5|nr:uncharacterized protein EI90DRAFT_3030720 [Cantharellus anzutake]KAF8342928.1 hypothetical protein EI90DRAFT_3030720 [Cantharellus anzutake]